MSTSTYIDVLEALLQFREGAVSNKSTTYHHSNNWPVPNPLDPTQPHIIEGDDAPTPVHHTSSVISAFSTTKQQANDDDTLIQCTTVPNPLATSVDDKKVPSPSHSPLRVSAIEALTSLSSVSSTNDNKPPPSGVKFVVTPRAIVPSLAPSCSCSGVSSATNHYPPNLSLNPEKVQHALISKPQRGKKRNLSEAERMEVTRTRNREHAKFSRMKKKARFQELEQIEIEFHQLKEKEELDERRRQHLIYFVENVSNARSTCIHSSKLMNDIVSSQDIIQDPKVIVIGKEVSLSLENSGMVKVSVCNSSGTDVESSAISSNNNPEKKISSGVIDAKFIPGTADIHSVALYWSSSSLTTRENFSSSSEDTTSLSPSVSVLSFES